MVEYVLECMIVGVGHVCVLQDFIQKPENLFRWSGYLGLHLNVSLVFAELVY